MPRSKPDGGGDRVRRRLATGPAPWRMVSHWGVIAAALFQTGGYVDQERGAPSMPKGRSAHSRSSPSVRTTPGLSVQTDDAEHAAPFADARCSAVSTRAS